MMLDVVGNHVGPIGDNFSAIIPYNKPEHYHSCVNTCDNFCNIPQSAYDSNPQQYTVIEQCRLQGLPDLNQTNPEVKDGLIQWLKSTLAKFDFDGLRVDTVKHVDPVSEQSSTCHRCWAGALPHHKSVSAEQCPTL